MAQGCCPTPKNCQKKMRTPAGYSAILAFQKTHPTRVMLTYGSGRGHSGPKYPSQLQQNTSFFAHRGHQSGLPGWAHCAALRCLLGIADCCCSSAIPVQGQLFGPCRTEASWCYSASTAAHAQLPIMAPCTTQPTNPPNPPGSLAAWQWGYSATSNTQGSWAIPCPTLPPEGFVQF